MQIRDQVFIVTGAASGLGQGVACMLAEAGARLVLADLQAEAGQALADRLNQVPNKGERDRAVFVCCDVCSQDDAQVAVQAAQALGSLRGLINCAGVAPAANTLGKDGPHTLEAFQRTVSINLFGSFNMARLAAQAMAGSDVMADGERGVIINTASVAAFDGQIGQTAYAASKAAIVGMTLPMARDLARHGIRVMTIAPGLFETPLLLDMPAPVLQSLGQSVPFPPRLGRATEFAQLVRSIIENIMLNGETIRLDGAIRMPPR